jgi:hypothetical protein
MSVFSRQNFALLTLRNNRIERPVQAVGGHAIELPAELRSAKARALSILWIARRRRNTSCQLSCADLTEAMISIPLEDDENTRILEVK